MSKESKYCAVSKLLLSLLTLLIFIYQHCHIYLIYSCYLPYSAIANATGTVATHFTHVT